MNGLLVAAAVMSATINVVGVVPPIIRVTPINSRCEDIYANIDVTVTTIEATTTCKALVHCKICSDGIIAVGTQE
jgi:hypothetical protein